MPKPSAEEERTTARPEWGRFVTSRRAAIALVLIVLCVADTAVFWHAMKTRRPTLKRWLPYAAELGRDDQLYERHPDYLYPPFFLVLLRPLTHVPPFAAALVWQAAKYLAIALVFKAAWSIAVRAGPLPPWAKMLSLVIAARFVYSDLRHGNINLYICLLVISAAWLLSRRRGFTAGLLVAFAACVKITPALWAVYLLYKRQWRALLGVLVGGLIAIEAVPLLVVSPRLNHALLSSWYAQVVTPFVERGNVQSPGMNQSLTAVTNRLFHRSDVDADHRGPILMVLSHRTIRWIQRSFAAMILLALAWSCRDGINPNRVDVLGCEWALVAPVTLALSGYTWTGHFCLLILGIVMLLSKITRDVQDRKPSPTTLLAVLAFAIFVVTTDLITPAGREWASGIGLPLLGALMLGTALGVMREQLRGKPPVLHATRPSTEESSA